MEDGSDKSQEMSDSSPLQTDLMDPSPPNVSGTSSDQNEESCGSKIDSGAGAFLIPGINVVSILTLIMFDVRLSLTFAP